MLLVPMLLLTAVHAFVPHTFGRLNTVRLFAEAEEVAWESAFPSAQVIEVSLAEHKPLGCTVEESLGDTNLKPVFVSKVRQGRSVVCVCTIAILKFRLNFPCSP